MRADRLLSIMLLLQTHGRMTTRDLAERLEVSDRTIHRDMDALSSAGVPVTADRGRGGGWFLLDGYETRLTGLTEPEVQSLFISKPDSLLQDLNMGTASNSALTKLLASLPLLLRHNAESMSGRIHIDVQGWRNTKEDISQLPTVQQAVRQGSVINIEYRKSSGEVVSRTVHPLGLVAKGSIWYLVATCDDNLRTYRVSRVLTAQMTGETVQRPVDFDLATYWETSKQDFVRRLPSYPVCVRAHLSIIPRLRSGGWYSTVQSVSAPDEGQWSVVEMMFELEENATAFVLSFGSQIEVIEPLSLRQKVIQLAEDVLSVYG